MSSYNEINKEVNEVVVLLVNDQATASSSTSNIDNGKEEDLNVADEKFPFARGSLARVKEAGRLGLLWIVSNLAIVSLVLMIVTVLCIFIAKPATSTQASSSSHDVIPPVSSSTTTIPSSSDPSSSSFASSSLSSSPNTAAVISGTATVAASSPSQTSSSPSSLVPKDAAVTTTVPTSPPQVTTSVYVTPWTPPPTKTTEWVAPKTTTTTSYVPAWTQAASSGNSASFTYYEPGGAGAKCDGVTHYSNEHIVALATGILGDHCMQGIQICSPQTGNCVEATVVDECDEHGGCLANTIDGTTALWNALGLDLSLGRVEVTYSF